MSVQRPFRRCSFPNPRIVWQCVTIVLIMTQLAPPRIACGIA